MNNKNVILASAAAIVAIIAVSGFAFSSFAADTNTITGNSNTNFGRQMGRGGMMSQNLTDEQKATMEAEREARRTEMQTAINAGYETWAALIKKNQGADAEILKTITASNFAKFKEGHSLLLQGRTIMEDLGLKGEGMGMKMGKGHGRGMGQGGNMPCGMNLNDDTLVQ